MLVIGAKGFAKEVLEVLYDNNYQQPLYFYDDVNADVVGKLFGEYSILKSEADIKENFNQEGFDFTIGIGDPLLRKKLYDKFTALGGKITSVISKRATIGHFDNTIGYGANIMTGTVLTSSITIGLAPLINLNCTIGHDCKIGDFIEMSPGVHVSGNCTIGDYVTIGTNATILPKVTIGSNVIIGAGTVVTKSMPDNCVVVGIPGKVIKELDPLK